MPPLGRPRSEEARTAVLRAVDDLLVEEGYAGVTMKGIAQRAGVGRQTVYRWWSTPAQILLEACVADAQQELRSPPEPDAHRQLVLHLRLLAAFLRHSHAGAAYLALLGAAQHDDLVRDLVRTADILAPSARECLLRVAARTGLALADHLDLHVAELVGPTVYAVLSGAPVPDAERLAGDLLRSWESLHGVTSATPPAVGRPS